MCPFWRGAAWPFQARPCFFSKPRLCGGGLSKKKTVFQSFSESGGKKPDFARNREFWTFFLTMMQAFFVSKSQYLSPSFIIRNTFLFGQILDNCADYVRREPTKEVRIIVFRRPQHPEFKKWKEKRLKVFPGESLVGGRCWSAISKVLFGTFVPLEQPHFFVNAQ